MAKVKPIGTKPTVKVKKDFLAIKIIVFVIFTLYAASLIFAVLYAFSISLKGVDEFHEKNLLPKEWLFSNYGQAFKEVKAGDSNMFVMLWNSIWYACGGAALGVFTSAITSYVVAKYRFPGRNVIWDEPHINNFDSVAAMIEEYNELYAGKDMTLYVNGNPANNIGDNTWTTTEDYMEQFYNKVLSKIDGRKIFSTDIYPLLETRGVYTLDSRWLRTMAVYANYAKDYDGEFHMFIQNYSSSINRETLSRKDFTYQIYTDMVFGINGYTYFTYRKSFIEEFGGGCVEYDTSCTPTPSYYWAQEVNAEIAKFDHVYLSFDWDGAMSVKGQYNLEDDEEYENVSFGFYKELTALNCATKVTATQDTLIGQFKDDEGRDALMVTNFTMPTDDTDDKVTIDFKDCNRAIVYENGERKVYEVKNNKLTLDIPSGEGVFVIPLKLKI